MQQTSIASGGRGRPATGEPMGSEPLHRNGPPGSAMLRVSRRGRQVLLGVLAVSAAYVGVWATIAPHDWYEQFPGLGMHWLQVLGPYNEHLARDVGGLYLALVVISVGALARAEDASLTRICGGAWAIFSVPHLVFHLAHLSMYTTRDQILNVVTLGGTVLIAVTLLLFPYKGAST